MNPRTLVTVAAVALMMLGTSRPASAQERYDFKIPFNFVANGRAFTAGQYVFYANQAGDVLTLESRDAKGGTVMLPVETRLAERKPLAEPEVVLDKLNGQDYVSELLVPGDDGYLVLVTKAKHSHSSLKGTRIKK